MGGGCTRSATWCSAVASCVRLALWLHFGIAGGWLHAKLLLVALILAHFIVADAEG